MALSVFHSFLLTNNIPLYGCTTGLAHSAMFHHMADVRVVSTSERPWIMLLGTILWACFQCSVYVSGVNFWVIQQLDIWLFEEQPNCFPKWWCHFRISPAAYSSALFGVGCTKIRGFFKKVENRMKS